MNSPESKSSVQTDQLPIEQKNVSSVSKMSGTATHPDIKAEVESVSDGLVEPILQTGSELSYVCLLIPRFSDHFLIGDIEERLLDFMKEICISFGWRLDAMAVRPGYVQWVMIVPLNVNPAHFMRIIRQHTSQKIFDEFPRYKQKNISSHFWAPGDFVVSGSRLQTAAVIHDYILQTRRYQGIV